MREPHRRGRLREAERLERVRRPVRLARVDVAVPARTRARVAEDLERRGATPPALGDVRDSGPPRRRSRGSRRGAACERPSTSLPCSAHGPSSTAGGADARRRAATSPCPFMRMDAGCEALPERWELEAEDLADRSRCRRPDIRDRHRRSELGGHRRELGVLEAAGGDPLRERRRVEIDVEGVAVRRHPARGMDADRRDLPRPETAPGGIQTPVSPSYVVASRPNAADACGRSPARGRARSRAGLVRGG